MTFLHECESAKLLGVVAVVLVTKHTNCNSVISKLQKKLSMRA